MQRWFFADELETCQAPVDVPSVASLTEPAIIAPIPECDWTFHVLVHGQDLYPNEKLAITGNCSALGYWQLNKCVVMTRDEDNNMWQAVVRLPRDHDVKYRFLVCAIDPANESIIVRRWETHLEARIIEAQHDIPEGAKPPTNKSTDIFGNYEGKTKIDRGWLTCETLVQLKFFNAPFKFKERMKRRLYYIKVTPMNLKIPTNGCDNSSGVNIAPNCHVADDSLSSDFHDTRDNGADLSTAFAFNEVVTLKPDDSELHNQPQFGTPCANDDMIIFHLTIGDFDSTAYLIDLYSYSSKAAIDEPPYHVGYHYVMPNLLTRSEGNLEVPITCASRHRPMGMMQLGYLIVRPLPNVEQNMEISYSRYWNSKFTGLDVGHRGLGPSFKTNDNPIRENTITSLKNAAEHGADMVEFDVQLSKDLVPVVYHDFLVYVLLKTKSDGHDDFLSLPIRELTLEQLKNLKVFHTAERRSREVRCFRDDDMQDHQPFPRLEEVLDAINPHVGFNIEIKWSQRLQDGTMEEEMERFIDRNLYVDSIVEVVLRRAGDRRIVFSCFDPDICTMLRFKQNRYPVMYLTLGVTEKYQKYKDPRCHTIQTAVYHATAMELLGIVAHTEDLLRDPTQVAMTRERGLVLFCWGEDNNNKDTIKRLKELGLHAIIYDKMDVLTSKEIKQSVFLLEAKESQQAVLKMQAIEMGTVYQDTPTINGEGSITE